MSLNLFNLLMEIKFKPGLYLGKPTLIGLNHFIHGYSTKEYEIGEDNSSFIDINDFQKYVENLYGIEATAKGSFMLIQEDSKNDKEAFYKYFEILEDYLSKK